MKTARRLLSAILSIVMIICAVPFSVGAEETLTTADGFEYTVDTEKGEVTITGYTGTEANLTIPAEIDGYPVKSIGDNAFADCVSLKSVHIGNIEELGYGAFAHCPNLTYVEIKDGLKIVTQIAFESCSLLSTVILPEGLLEIGGSAFTHCTSLESIDIPSTVTVIDDYAFYGCTSLKSINLPNVLTINKAVFSECASLESIEIPISVDVIEDRAFEACVSLKEITVPSLVTSIGAGAFAGCTSLSLVNIVSPLGIESIGMYAFSNCSALKRFTIARTVTSVGDSAFAGCEGLEEIDYHGTKSDWKKISFGEGNELFLSLPIKYHAAANNKGFTFEYDRSNLTATLVKFESSATTVLEIPSEMNGYMVTKIGAGCVSEYNRLKEVIIPDTVIEIGAGAFCNCSGLERITMPASVKKIDTGAFMYSIDDAIYYTGTEEEWNNIEVDSKENYGFLEAKVVFIRNGDANKDGSLNAKDINLMKRYLAGQIDADEIYIDYADMNGDGTVTAVDNLLIRKRLAGAEA